ncbi:hypothetical protein [Halolamina sediminis]|uniref:hypothetical protein n=1 Tax=Halolamina sediminis TaxID=1480675 RepID=UPI0006B4BC5F|nr:hypothetical protein [Halolamina sediminis]
MASAGERAFSLLLTLLVVGSAVGVGVAPSPAGTAIAQAADTEECSAWDAILYDFANVGNFNLFGGEKESNPCSAEYVKDEISEEWNATDAAETKAEIHARAGQLSASNTAYLDAINNGLTNSETIAFSRAEAAAVETLANGGTVSEAQQAANESIENFYAVKQLNLVDEWNVGVETVVALDQRAANTTGVSDNFVKLSVIGSVSPRDDNKIRAVDAPTEDVSVLNGTGVSLKQIPIKDSAAEGDASFLDIIYNPSNDPYIDAGGATTGVYVVVDTTENLTSTTAIPIADYLNTWESIENKSQQTKTEAAVYINQSLAPAAEDGNISDHISPATLAQEYAQDYNGSDSYVRALAIAAYSGMETPSLENVGSMTVEMNGTSYTGLLLSQSAPADGWQSNTTYDPATVDGLQLFAVAGDTGEVMELDQPFTVSKITGKDGGEIQTADTISLTYDTTNAAENYSERQEQIRQLQLELEERKAQATSGPVGTGSGEGALNALAQFLGVSVGAAVGVVVVAGLIIGKIYTEY